MIAKINQLILDFYNRFISDYLSAYFFWLTEKLSGTNPFGMISVSIVLFFVLAIYIWHRNRS